MKTSTLAVVSLLVAAGSIPSHAGGCSFDSALRIGSGGFDVGFGVDLSETGDRLVAGAFSATATFGSGVLRTSNGIEDLFVAKYNHDGSPAWVVTTGAQDFDGANDAKLTADGGAVACGYFARTVQFGGASLTYVGGLDAWVGKIDASGQFEWVRAAGSANVEEARGVAVDPQGNIFIAGYFNATAAFAPGVSVTSNGNADVFLAKYSPQGDLLWVKSVGGTGFDSAEGLCVDAKGDAFVVGRFQNTVNLRPGAAGGVVTSVGSSDIFLAKFDGATGLVDWVRAAGSTSVDRGVGVGVDATGAAYIAGFFAGPMTIGGVNLTPQNNDDMFLAKFAADGAPLWAQRAATTVSYVQGLALDANANGDVAVAGYLGGTTTFGDAAFGPTAVLVSAGSFDAFVATFDSSGALRCAVRAGAGGVTADYGYGVAINEQGAVAATGEFGGVADFGDMTLSAAGQDAWLATIPAPASGLMGDLNGDGVVNFADLNIVLSAFGSTGVPGMTPGDANGDGVVNFADLNIVLSAFGSGG